MNEEGNNNADRSFWFAARTRHGQELKVRGILMDRGMEYFIPTETGVRMVSGRKRKYEKPLIPCLVFLRSTKSVACSLANSCGLPVWYIIDKGTHTMLVVPDKQLEDFRRVVEDVPDAICPEGVTFAPGQKVQVTKGPFKGIEGDVLSDEGATYVVLTLGGLLSAKVKVPKSYLMVLK